MNIFHKQRICRACGSTDLELILDLGKTALANDFIAPNQAGGYSKFIPLRFCICRKCSLGQLAEVVIPEVLYSHYAYTSSTSKTMDVHIDAQANHLKSLLTCSGTPRVFEIASNTGICLQKYKSLGFEVLGIEPASNISAMAESSGIPTRTEYFSCANAGDIYAEIGDADLILGRHVLAHIDDWQDLLCALEKVSNSKTLIVFEVPYLEDMRRLNQFDTIYHEHLSYISVKSVLASLKESPFFLHRVDRCPIHGGSIALHIRHRGSGIEPDEGVREFLRMEDKLGLNSPKSWQLFCSSVVAIKTQIRKLFDGFKLDGKSIIGYGASARGNTFISVCGIGSEDLGYIIDNTPFKQNKVTPGSWIPICPPENLLRDQPDYALILAWTFANEIISREQEYKNRGGRFIVPIPFPQTV